MKSLYERIMDELDADKAMEHVHWLTENTPSRISGTGQDRKAAEYLVDKMKSYGLEAGILEFETYNSRPGKSFLRLVSPENREIMSLPCCHVEPTPEGGKIYDLIYVGAGAEEDYEGKDVEGKAVLVEVSYAPATPEKAMIARRHKAEAMICMNWGRRSEHVICMRGLKTVWGNPTPDTFDKIPKITGCSITRADGEDLRDMCLKGDPVKIHMEVTAERLWETLPQPVGYIRGKEEPEKFLLVSAHLDAWSPGVTCNATGDATMLEMARVFAKFKDELKRSICFAYWNGHEIAEAAGSTWFADTYWDSLSENCIGYVNIDSTGMKDADTYDLTASRELGRFASEAVWNSIGEDVEAVPLSKIGDQSFFGLGIPAIFGRLSYNENVLEQTHGATLGWWNHTAEDGMDKADPVNIGRDNMAEAAYILGIVNSEILPYDFTDTAADIFRKLETLAPFADGIMDMKNLTDKAKKLCVNVKALNEMISEKKQGSKAEERRAVNDVMIRISRSLTGPFYTACGRYSQDSYGLSVLAKPVPLLYPLVEMSRMDKEDTGYRLMKTQMLRNRNMLSDALSTANESIERLLKK